MAEIMTRTQIIELMALTIAEGHHERGLSAFAEATDVFDKLHAAGLAIVPVEPSEEMVVAAHEWSDRWNSDETFDQKIPEMTGICRAMITAALKQRERT